MATAITLNSRLIAVEDLALTGNPDGETFSANVLGLGSTVLNKFAPLQLTDLTQGVRENTTVQLGQVYWDTSSDQVSARVVPRRETPFGGTDDTNLVYSLSATPLSGSLMFFKNGCLLKPGIDYTLAANLVTMLGASGTCTTLGMIVSAVTGTFRKVLEGEEITINAVAYVIATVVNGTTLILTRTAGTQATVNWSATGAPAVGQPVDASFYY